jgi:hypothetical protein
MEEGKKLVLITGFGVVLSISVAALVIAIGEAASSSPASTKTHARYVMEPCKGQRSCVARCPTGMRVIAGSCDLIGGPVELWSEPKFDHDNRVIGWSCAIDSRNEEDGRSVSMSAQAFCEED